MEGKRESWCGLVVRKDAISVCLLCGSEDQQVRLFQNTPEDHESLVEWLEGEGRTHIALRPDYETWKEVHEALKTRFQVRIVHEQRATPAAREDHKACCQWLANLLKSGRLDKQDQVEPIGDRFPFSDEDALGGQPGKKPEHSGK